MHRPADDRAGTVIRKDASSPATGPSRDASRPARSRIGARRRRRRGDRARHRTAMGDGAQLGHASSLHAGQASRKARHWHGSPAGPPTSTTALVPRARCGTAAPVRLRRPAAAQRAGRARPARPGAWSCCRSSTFPSSRGAASPARRRRRPGVLPVLSAICGAVPRRDARRARLRGHRPAPAQPVVRARRVYPLYGVHYWSPGGRGLTNSGFFRMLFGDSSCDRSLPAALGTALAPVEQTGSNFGLSEARLART